MIVRIYGVYGLNYSEGKQKDCGKKGQNSPWISEISMDESGTPPMQRQSHTNNVFFSKTIKCNATVCLI